MTHVAGMSGPTRRELDLKHVTVTGKDGHAYLLRPIQPGDAPSLMRGYDAMSDQAKWFRMLHTLPHLTEEMARRFCSPDHDRDLCIVIIGHGTLDGEILGGARIVGELNGQSAEFSVSLRPEAQGLGLARAALQMLHFSPLEYGPVFRRPNPRQMFPSSPTPSSWKSSKIPGTWHSCPTARCSSPRNAKACPFGPKTVRSMRCSA